MNRPTRTLLPLVALAMASLTGCQTTTRTGEIKAGCLVFDPITYSRNDTPETAKQVRQHNAAWESLCR